MSKYAEWSVKDAGASSSYNSSRVAGDRAYARKPLDPLLSEHESFCAVVVSRKAVTKTVDLRCQERTLTPSEDVKAPSLANFCSSLPRKLMIWNPDSDKAAIPLLSNLFSWEV